MEVIVRAKGAEMAGSDELKGQWTGHDLFDLEGDKIGTVEDVVYGGASGDPGWLVVGTGAPGADKIMVPVAEVRRAGDRLSVPHTKERVAGAPQVEDALALTEVDKGKLCRYYGLQYVASADEPAEGCEDMTDLRPGG
jgi:hypothetical protein